MGFARERVVEAGGVSTRVFESGEGAPVVLLHGNPDTHTVWEGLVDALSGSYRCIAPDLPGFGGSIAPDDFDVTLAGQARWVRALFDALELERAHLVVHDVGGTYGLAFAAEDARARLASLTIFNTIFTTDYRWHFWGRVWRTPLLGELAMAAGNEWLFVRETQKGSPGITKERARAAWREFTPTTRKMVLRFYREANPENFAGWYERLMDATANTPKLVLWGDRDPYIGPRFADRFGVAAKHFTKAGHWLMFDHPEEVARAVAAHLLAR